MNRERNYEFMLWLSGPRVWDGRRSVNQLSDANETSHAIQRPNSNKENQRERVAAVLTAKSRIVAAT